MSCSGISFRVSNTPANAIHFPFQRTSGRIAHQGHSTTSIYSMRIWILTQYYPPEVGAAAIRLSRLASLLAAEGHEVLVLTSLPNYPKGIIEPPYRGHLVYHEYLDLVHLQRVWVYASPNRSVRARLLNQVSFLIMVALAGTFMKTPDVLLVESHPLFVCLVGGWLRRVKRAPVVLNVSDLWPESAVATGMLSANSAIVRVAERVERWAYRDADHIVGLTQGVIDGILRVYPRPERVTLIPNGTDLNQFRPATSEERDAAQARLGIKGHFVAAHIGNMSLTYDFDIILQTAAALPGVIFLFAGDGSQAAHVREQIAQRNLANVMVLGLLPHQDMPSVWAAADACLIALRDHSLAGGTRPAKMYEAIATGTPIVAAIRGEGEALLKDAGAGIAVPIGDAGAMIQAVQTLVGDRALRDSFSKKGRAYAEANLSPAHVKHSYLNILESVSNG